MKVDRFLRANHRRRASRDWSWNRDWNWNRDWIVPDPATNLGPP
jgi:hypothetical protein